MSWLGEHLQSLLAIATVAAAAGYLGRSWVVTRRRKAEGSGCGACAHNPRNQLRAPARDPRGSTPRH